VTNGKPVSAVVPLVDFYDTHGRKREVIFFCSVPDSTRNKHRHESKHANIIVKNYNDDRAKLGKNSAILTITDSFDLIPKLSVVKVFSRQ
jgi:hypothetical protein